MRDRQDILGVGFDRVSRDEAYGLVLELAEGGGMHQVITANAELVMQARRCPDLGDVLASAQLVLADGVGVIWASRLLHAQPLPQRIPGIELCAQLLETAASRGWPVYCFGTTEQRLAAATARLSRAYPGLTVVGSQHGYAEDRQAVAQAIAQSGARLLLVGLGAPAQELFISQQAHLWRDLVAVGVGGSFDVWSGDKPRAPAWMQRYGLEWLFRLLKEPRRYRRQLALPAFALAVLRAYFMRKP